MVTPEGDFLMKRMIIAAAALLALGACATSTPYQPAVGTRYG